MNEVILVISFKEKLSFKLKIKEYKIQIFVYIFFYTSGTCGHSALL